MLAGEDAEKRAATYVAPMKRMACARPRKKWVGLLDSTCRVLGTASAIAPHYIEELEVVGIDDLGASLRCLD